MVSWISWSCAKHHFSLEQHLSLTFRKLFQLHFIGSSKFLFLPSQVHGRKFYFIKAQNYWHIKSKIYNTTISCSKVLIWMMNRILLNSEQLSWLMKLWHIFPRSTAVVNGWLRSISNYPAGEQHSNLLQSNLAKNTKPLQSQSDLPSSLIKQFFCCSFSNSWVQLNYWNACDSN